MIAASTCDEMTLLMQAEIDGELDAAEIASVTAHRVNCAACEEVYAALVALRGAVRSNATRYAASSSFGDALQARLRRELPTKGNPAASILGRLRRWLRDSGLGFVAGALVAASLTLIVMTPNQGDMTALIVSGHIRALQPGHLLDVASTDQHNVKPWFDGRLDFAPPVKDLKEQGFPLEGGRLDYLDGHEVAAVVYHSRQHPINLFVWPTRRHAADTEPSVAANKGYNVVSWTQNDMSIWVVSDLNRGELSDFVKQWRQMP